MTRGDLAEAIGLLERSLGGIVKALLESGVGQSGTVAALTIDEFVVKIKSALGSVTGGTSQPTTASDAVSAGALPGGASSPAHFPASPSSSQAGAGSRVPSAFGVDESSASVVVASTSVTKPGKNLLRSCEGF